MKLEIGEIIADPNWVSLKIQSYYDGPRISETSIHNPKVSRIIEKWDELNVWDMCIIFAVLPTSVVRINFTQQYSDSSTLSQEHHQFLYYSKKFKFPYKLSKALPIHLLDKSQQKIILDYEKFLELKEEK